MSPSQPQNGRSKTMGVNRICVVDDEETIVQLLTEYFQNLGYEVDGFTDPVQAVKSIKEKAYDLVMTDLKMPSMDGMQVVREVRSTGRDTLIIIFTGYASLDSAIQAVKEGVYDYLRKPFRLKEIEVVVNRALQKLELERSNRKLNEKLKLLNSYMRLLNDVNRIVYQVVDRKMAVQMILDTLNEGLKLKQIAVMLPDSEKRFKPFAVSGIEAHYIDKLTFTRDSLICGEKVPEKEKLYLESIGNFTIDAIEFGKPTPFHNFLLIPIVYRDLLKGFLWIFNLDSKSIEMEELINLLQVVAVQLGPPCSELLSYDTFTTGTPMLPIQNFIQECIDEADTLKGNVGFFLCRYFPLRLAEEFPAVNEINSGLQEIIKEVFRHNLQIFPLLWDTYLIVVYGSDAAELELAGANLRSRVEKQWRSLKGESLVGVKSAAVIYPRDGTTPQELLKTLNHKIVHEFQRLLSGSNNTF